MNYTMLIYEGDEFLYASHNVSMIPRIGDTIKILKCKCKVKDVIWHITPSCTWVEIQVQ